MKIQFYLLIFLSFITNTIYSQCETYDITYRTKNSDVIFEGEIINQECFRDRNTNRIFTKNTVNIFKVFKGNVTSNRIDIITLGGEIENEIVWLSHSVDVFKNKHAVFFTKRTDRGGFGNSVRINQGAFNLDFQNDKAWNEYCTISNIEQEIFSSIEQETGIKREVKFLNSYEKSMNYILEGQY